MTLLDYKESFQQRGSFLELSAVNLNRVRTLQNATGNSYKQHSSYRGNEAETWMMMVPVKITNREILSSQKLPIYRRRRSVATSLVVIQNLFFVARVLLQRASGDFQPNTTVLGKFWQKNGPHQKSGQIFGILSSPGAIRTKR